MSNNLNSSQSSLHNRSTRSIGDFTPSYEKIFVPTNKETVLVYHKGRSSDDNNNGSTGGGDDDSWHDSKNSSFSSLRSTGTPTTNTTTPTTSTLLMGKTSSNKSHFKGEWQVVGYTATTASSPSKARPRGQGKPDEVWVFRDDDPNGIDGRVMENRPLRGRWGYSPSVPLNWNILSKKVTMAVESPSDMWFFPPHIKEFPNGFQPLGDWIKPVYHKDLSILSPGQSGFFTVGKGGSADTGFGTAGNWKMYGHNDQSTSGAKVVVKKNKKKPAAAEAEAEAEATPTPKKARTPPIPKSPASVNKKPSAVATTATKIATPRTASTPPIPKSPASVATPTKKKAVGKIITTRKEASTDEPPAQAATSKPPLTPQRTGKTIKTKIKVGPTPVSPTSTYQVHVRKPAAGVGSDSSTFTVQVQPSYKVGQFKQKINRTRGIPLDIIQLSFNGKTIGGTVADDKKTLQSLGIHNDDTIDLAGIQLYIRTPKGKKFLLTNIDPEISIDTLKELITVKVGTPVSEQQLVFLNQLLEDGDTITKYKIKNKNIIELQPSGTMAAPPPRTKKMIVVKNKNGPKAAVAPDIPTSMTSSTSSMASSTGSSTTASSSKPSKKTVATKRTPSSSLPTTNDDNDDDDGTETTTFTSPTPPKKKAAAAVTTATTPSSTKPKKSSLKKAIATSNLGDSSSSLSLASPNPASMKKKWIVRLLQPDNNHIKLAVDPTDTLDVLQRKAAKKVGLPIHLMCLLDARGRSVLSHDTFTLEDGATLRVAPVVAVTNSQTNRTIKLSVPPDVTTVKDLKRVLEDRMEVPMGDQELYLLDGPGLEEDDTMLLDDTTRVDRDLNLRLDVAAAPQDDDIIGITVMTPNGKSFVLDIDQSDDETIIREKIAKKAGVSVQQLRLIREDDGEDIDRDNFMIKNGDVLVVGKPQITIQKADGEVMKLELDLYEASSSKVLRRKIAKEVGIPVSELRVAKDGEVLDDDYRPCHGDHLVVALPRITVQCPDGETFRLDVDSGDDAAHLKERIAQEIGVPISGLRLLVNNSTMKDNYKPSYGDVLTVEPPRITVTTPDGQTLHIDVYPDDSARDVRLKIANEAGISLDKLNLSMDSEELEEDYVPSNGDVLTIDPPPSIVTVELPDGEKLEFEAAPSTTIGDIKEILKDETGTSESDQQLFRLSGGGGALNDDMLIQEDIDLRLEIPVAKEEEPSTINVTVTTYSGQIYNLDIEQFEAAANVLKRKIAKEAGMPVKNFRLSIDDVEVDKDYVAKNGDKMTLTPISKIAVRTTKGRIFNLDIQPEDTAIDIRQRISRETGIPENALILAVNGEELNRDSMPLHGDLLTIELPYMTVITGDGKSVKIDIEINETHKFMRRKIARKVGVPLDELRLSKGDKELAHNYMPSHGDVLSVMTSATLKVQLPDCSTLELPYSLKMTIGELKNLLEDESGIKKADQCLFSSEIDEDLEDSALVDDKLTYRMEIAKEPFTITVCTPDDQVLTIDISSCKSASEMREKVSEEIGLPVKELRLTKDGEEVDEDYMPSHEDYLTVEPPTVTVRLPDGSDLELSASPTTTIADIKEALEDELGILATDQILLEQKTGKVLANDMPIESSINLSLQVPEKPFTITVHTPDDQVFVLEIAPTESAKDVRAKIAEEIGIPFDEVRLSKDEEELDENYLPSNGDEVSVEPPTITVKLPNGSVLELSALPTTTVGDLKETLEEEMGISTNDQRLYLLNDKAEMDDNSFVKHMMELRLELSQNAEQNDEGEADTKAIIIKTHSGDSFSIDVAPNATLKDMKNEIADRVGIPMPELRLIANDDEDELDDGFLPADGDVLVVGAPSVKVRLPNGDEVELEAMATTTIGDVKETLEEETGIAATRQCLFFIDSEGKQLEDEMLIQRDLHLQLEDSVDVKVKDVDGNELSLQLCPRDTFADIRDEIEKRTSVPASELRLSMGGDILDGNYVPKTGDVLTIKSQRICVELPEGTRVHMPLLPTNTIADLKASIEEKSGIPRDSQKITFLQNDTVLADDMLLSRPKFYDGIVLQLKPEIPEVTVNTHDGKSFVMKLDPKDTKNDVRYKIAKEIGIPTQDLRLSKDGTPLDRKYKPMNGDVLTVEGQRIRVDLPDNSRIEISVMPTQSLAEVKDAIEKLSGISKGDQRLFFANGKAELDDNKAVSKYGLDESLVLQVRLSEQPPTVNVKLPDGRTFKMNLDQGKSLDQMKMEIEKEYGLPVGTLKMNGKILNDLDGTKPLNALDVRVKDGDEVHVGPASVETTLPDGSTIQFEALPKMTIKDLKVFVASKMPNAGTDDLRILSRGELDPLSDATSLAKVDFTKGLTVQEEPIRATVKVPGKAETVSVTLQRNETIGKLKETLARENNLDQDNILLFHNGTELDDAQNFIETGIEPDSVLEVEIFQFQVMVMDSSGGHILTINDMPQSTTIGNLKQRIMKEQKIPDEKQVLLLNDTILDENQKSLRDSGVKHMSVLVLEMAAEKEFQIAVEHWNGEVFTVDAKPSDNLDAIKERIAALTNILPEKQTLTNANVPVENRQSLSELGIGEGSKLQLQQQQIYVTLPNGEQHSVSVEPDFTIQRVKELLSAVTLLEVDDQTLLKGEEHVENSSTLVDCGVKVGDTLVLEAFSVNVLCWSGDVLDLEGIRSSDTVDRVKEILSEKKSVPKEKQRIMRGGAALEDGKRSLASYGVRHKDTLLLDNPEKMESQSSASKKGKSPFSFLQKATNLLASPKPKDSTDVEQNDGDGVDRKSFVNITVVTPELNSIKLEIPLDIPASQVRERIANGVGVPLDELRLSKFGDAVDEAYMPSQDDVLTVEPPPTVAVYLPDGSKLELAASPSTTIDDIKDCLEDETGVCKADQKLFLKKGKDDDEEEVLDDMIIDDDIELRLVVPGGVDGSAEDETEYEYEEIEEEEVDHDETVLVSDSDEDGKGEEAATTGASDDGHVVSSPKRTSNVNSVNTKYKSLPMEIHIQDSKGTRHTIAFQKEATVEELKYKIPSHAVKAESIVDQCILFHGKELDPNKTLEECKVTDGDVLQLESYALQIMHFLSVVLPFDSVSRLDTIGTVKEKLSLQQSIPKHQQKLSIQGENVVLSDNRKTLKDYGIKHMTVLILQEDSSGSSDDDDGPSGENPSEQEDDSEMRAKNLDDRIAKIKERAEARKMARMKSGK